MENASWPCLDCGDVREFVQPPCADGHTDDGGDCPEWACADCGSAVVTGHLGPATEVLRPRVAA